MRLLGLLLLMMFEFFLSMMMAIQASDYFMKGSVVIVCILLGLSWFNFKSAAAKFVWFKEAPWLRRKD